MSNNRASLLAGLRTGGVVRSPSANGMDSSQYAPRTAAVDGHFNPSYMNEMYGKYDQSDYGNQMFDYNAVPPSAPATQNVFLQQQQHQLNQQNQARAMLQARVQAQAVQNAILSGRPNRGVSLEQQQQALQVQMEMLKLQAYHDQQQQQQQLMMLQAQALLSPSPVTNIQARRRSTQPPATAAPTVTSFGQARNFSVNEPPATAGLETQFPKRERSVSSALNPNAATFELKSSPPKRTAVPSASATATNWRSSTIEKTTRTNGSNDALSGGTPLGVAPAPSPAKHQGAASWRRPTVTRQESESKVSTSSSPTSTPPRVYVSTPEETSPAPSPTETSHQVPAQSQAARTRPPSLRFSVSSPSAATKHSREPSFQSSDGGQVLYAPNTTETEQAPLTAREEASRRLYEGLGIGRPVPSQQTAQQTNGNLTAGVAGRFENNSDLSIAGPRTYSLPSRQPRGPPAGVEELGNRNFASRIRHKALGALLNARDRRSSALVEAF